MMEQCTDCGYLQSHASWCALRGVSPHFCQAVELVRKEELEQMRSALRLARDYFVLNKLTFYYNMPNVPNWTYKQICQALGEDV